MTQVAPHEHISPAAATSCSEYNFIARCISLSHQDNKGKSDKNDKSLHPFYLQYVSLPKRIFDSYTFHCSSKRKGTGRYLCVSVTTCLGLGCTCSGWAGSRHVADAPVWLEPLIAQHVLQQQCCCHELLVSLQLDTERCIVFF